MTGVANEKIGLKFNEPCDLAAHYGGKDKEKIYTQAQSS